MKRSFSAFMAFVLAVLVVLNYETQPARAFVWAPVAVAVAEVIGDVALSKASDVTISYLEGQWKLPANERKVLTKGLAIAKKTPNGWVKAGITAGAVAAVGAAVVGAWFLRRTPSDAGVEGAPVVQPGPVQFVHPDLFSAPFVPPASLPPARSSVGSDPVTTQETYSGLMPAEDGRSYKWKHTPFLYYDGTNCMKIAYLLQCDNPYFDLQRSNDPQVLNPNNALNLEPGVYRFYVDKFNYPCAPYNASGVTETGYTFTVPPGSNDQRWAPAFNPVNNSGAAGDLKKALGGAQTGTVSDDAPTIYPVNPDDPNSPMAISENGTIPDENKASPSPSAAPAGAELHVISSNQSSTTLGWSNIPATVINSAPADMLRVFVDGNVLVGNDSFKAAGSVTISVGNQARRQVTIVPYSSTKKAYGPVAASTWIEVAVDPKPSASPSSSPTTQPSAQPTTQPTAQPTAEPSSAPSAEPPITRPDLSFDQPFFVQVFLDGIKTKFPFDLIGNRVQYDDPPLVFEMWGSRTDFNWTKPVWRGVEVISIIGMVWVSIIAL